MPGSMRCPLCGASDAYVGFNVVECRQTGCAAYTPADPPKTLISGEDWRRTIARVRANARATTPSRA